MRHDFVAGPITSGASCMQMATATRALIAPAGVPHACPSHRPGALGRAIALTAIATAADLHLCPTAGTQKQTTRNLHRRSPENAEDEADVRLDGCVMAALYCAPRNPQPAAVWVQARLRLHFARVTPAPRLWSLRQRRSYPPKRGAAQPGDSSAPRLGYQPVVWKQSSATRGGSRLLTAS